MPKKVKNYVLITYEDLIKQFDKTMNLIKNKGLEPKNKTFQNIENENRQRKLKLSKKYINNLIQMFTNQKIIQPNYLN